MKNGTKFKLTEAFFDVDNGCKDLCDAILKVGITTDTVLELVSTYSIFGAIEGVGQVKIVETGKLVSIESLDVPEYWCICAFGPTDYTGEYVIVEE